jgi:hypothetical protein
MFGFASQVGQAGLSEALQEFIRALSGTANEAEPLAKTLGKTLARGVRLLTRLLLKLRRNAETVGKVVKALGIGFAVLASASVAPKILEMGKAFRAFGALLNPVALKVALIAGALLIAFIIIDDLVAFMEGRDSLIGRSLGEDSQQADSFRKSLQTIAGSVQKAIGGINKALGKIDLSIMDLFAITLLVVVELVVLFIQGLVGIGTAIGIGLGATVVFFAETLPQAIRDFFDLLGQGVDGAIQSFSDMVGAVAGFFVGLWDGIVAGVVALFTGVVDLFLSIFNFLFQVVDTFVGLWVGLFEAIVTFIDEKVLTPIVDLFTAAWELIDEAFITPIKEAIELIVESLETVIDKAGDALNTLNPFSDESTVVAASADEAVRTAEALGFGGVSDLISTQQAVAQQAAGTAAPAVGATSNVSVGAVSVNVAGSADMDQRQLRTAVAAGTGQGLDDVMRRNQRRLGGG